MQFGRYVETLQRNMQFSSSEQTVEMDTIASKKNCGTSPPMTKHCIREGNNHHVHRPRNPKSQCLSGQWAHLSTTEQICVGQWAY
jgi:hypothetical protein